MGERSAFSAMRDGALRLCLDAIPSVLSLKISALLEKQPDFSDLISEIRVRVGEISCAVVQGRSVAFSVTLGKDDISDCLGRITRGAMHIHRDTLLKGYMSLPYGVRVGIVGSARYDGGTLFAIGEVSALVFRLPFFDEGIGRLIRDEVMRAGLASALIYSPPACGKTTALRSLARAICEREFVRVVIVDERREVFPELYLDTGVDILSGFAKAEGIEMATRYLNPEIIMVDELGASEADAVRHTALCGVPVVATVHAGKREELPQKSGIGELLRIGVFDYTVGIVRVGGGFGIEVERV